MLRETLLELHFGSAHLALQVDRRRRFWLWARTGGAAGGETLGEIESQATWSRLGNRLVAAGGYVPPEAETLEVLCDPSVGWAVSRSDDHWLVAAEGSVETVTISLLDATGGMRDQLVIPTGPG